MGTFSESSSTAPTRAISIVYSSISFTDDRRGNAQASVCYAGQHQRHVVNGTPTTYNTTCQQALPIGFEVDLRQTPPGHGATCPDEKIVSKNPA
jgi:hypothetical protein